MIKGSKDFDFDFDFRSECGIGERVSGEGPARESGSSSTVSQSPILQLHCEKGWLERSRSLEFCP